MNQLSLVTVAVAAGLVASAAIWFALLNWRALEAKRRTDLFELRFEVYIEFWQEAYAILQVGPPDEARRHRLLILLQKARFLFSEEIYRYLQEFMEKADELARSEYLGDESDADRAQAGKARMDNLLWFDRQAEELARLFRPYLGTEPLGAVAAAAQRKRPAKGSGAPPKPTSRRVRKSAGDSSPAIQTPPRADGAPPPPPPTAPS